MYFHPDSCLVIYVGDDNLSEGQASLYPSDQPGLSEALQDTAQSTRLGLGQPTLESLLHSLLCGSLCKSHISALQTR